MSSEPNISVHPEISARSSRPKLGGDGAALLIHLNLQESRELVFLSILQIGSILFRK